MPIQFGNNNIKLDGISEVYVGSNKVYSATPPGPPVIDNPVNEYFCVYSAKNFTISFEKIQTASGANGNLNYNNLKLKYSTNKTTWTEVSAAQGFNFSGGTLYYIYTSSAEVGTTSSDTNLGLQSAAWGQVCSAPAYGYYSYTSTRMKFSGTSTIYLMGNIRTIAQGDQATPYNGYVGSKTTIDYVATTASSSSYYIYYTRACGLGASTYQHSYSPYTLRARGISNIQGTSNSIIDINNLFIGDHEDTGSGEVSYPTFTYSTGTPYTPPYDPINDYFWVENTSNASKRVCFNLMTVYMSGSWSSLQERYGSGTLYYSTNKTSWSTISTNTYATIIYLTVPANTRYYLYMSWPAYGTTYSSFNYTSGGTATISGWGAYIIWGNYAYTGRCSSVFRAENSSDNNVFVIGGNIRTITGSGQNGVSSTTQTYYDRASYYKASSYTNVRYWTGLGKSTDSVISNRSQSGLYFQYIKDASQLYIGSTDVRPDFLNSGPNFVGPIYT